VADIAINAKPIGGPADCPLCSESLAAGGPTQPCPGCEVSYHLECLEELGGCGTLGCARSEARRPARPAAPRRADPARTPIIGAAVLAIATVLIVVMTRSPSRPNLGPYPASTSHAQSRVPSPEPFQIDLGVDLGGYERTDFVFSVKFVIGLRQLERQGIDLGDNQREFLETRRSEARKSYVSLLRSSDQPPQELQAELRRAVHDKVDAKHVEEADAFLEEIFASVESGPASR
jgi:hypothetical protein